MRKILWKTLYPIIIGLTVFGGIGLFNQLNIFANTIAREHIYGYYIIWGIFILVGAFMILPIIKLILLPTALKRPYIHSPTDEKRRFYKKYKERILKEYKRNDNNNFYKYIDGESIKKLEKAQGFHSIKKALIDVEKGMDKEADKEIKKYSKAVFTSTALSQNGTLDAILVLKLQIELIWKISHIYNQKPKLKELIDVYISVLANALTAAALSEISIEELIDNLIRQATGGVSNIFTKGFSKVADSILDGTSNAYLSLRVGYLTKDYCKYSNEFDEKNSRKNSRDKAIKMIKEVGVMDTVVNIIKKREE